MRNQIIAMHSTTCPQIGTPAQDAFARKIADACQVLITDAVNDALHVPTGSPVPAALDKYAASLVIHHLLALVKIKGVQGFDGKGRRRKGGKRRDASPNSNPDPAPAASNGSTGPGTQLQDFTPAALAEELERRGYPAGLALSNPDLTGGAAALLAAAVRVVLAGSRAQKGACLPLELAGALTDLRGAIADTGADV